jgi:hydrogenase expression/formation protein HypE
LVRDEIVSRFGQDALQGLPDAALLCAGALKLLFTTDSFVVQPLFFPGGNIGDLAVNGAVNDLCVCGAKPRWLSLALILEEGLPFKTLGAVLDAVKSASEACGVMIITGDTKVVRRGQADGMYITTSAIGELMAGFTLGVARIELGDTVLVSGPLGDHGMAVMAAREAIKIENGPSSDTASVHPLVFALESLAPRIKFMRDPTRGGLSAVLNEVVAGQKFGVEIKEAAIPFSASSRALSEMLGLDLLQVACEGRIVLICAKEIANDVLKAWQALPEGRLAAVIGQVVAQPGRMILETVNGGRRVIDLPLGELLPRIC